MATLISRCSDCNTLGTVTFKHRFGDRMLCYTCIMGLARLDRMEDFADGTYDPEIYDNALHLDEFYINAACGIDAETGEVVNPALEAATQRDRFAYGQDTRF